MTQTGFVCPFKGECVTQCALFIAAPYGKDLGTCSIKAIANLLDHLKESVVPIKLKD